MALSSFQEMLWNEMDPGQWYDVFPGKGGRGLPDWFHAHQPDPLRTIGLMRAARAVVTRNVGQRTQAMRINGQEGPCR